MRTARTLACVTMIAAAALALAGCGPTDYNPGPETCDRSEAQNKPVLYSGGTRAHGVYMTSAWDGDLLYFPGGMHYLIEHDLGEAPRFFEAYLSFDPHGAHNETGDDAPLGLASGNQVELLHVDDTYLKVRNAECVDYWLLVVAGVGTTP